LGAYNAITGKLTYEKNESYINADTVCTMLRKLAKEYSGQRVTIVLDNARYQHCKKVEELAKELKIKLLFLPSYSPNLNLIERLWKFIKKKCLNNLYYENFNLFKNGITNCLKKINTKKQYKKELKKLMTLNFQNLKKVNIMTA
jgi:transposase